MRRLKDAKGFTIIELLIATAVFSIVLLVISAAIIQIGRIYYKGITSARTQEVTRSVIDDVSQTIQFTAGSISSGTGALCVGNQRYSFDLGKQRAGSQHSLVVDDASAGCSPVPQNLTGIPAAPAGRELLGDKMRLANFAVSQVGTTNSYNVIIRVVYGDNDLLCSPTVSGSCTSNAVMSDFAKPDLTCKSIRSGTQFCAVSELSTIVERRLVE